MNFPLPPKESGLLTIAVDIDGTLTKETHWPYPVLGEPNVLVLEAIQFWVKNGYEVVLYSARPGYHMPLIRQWLKEQGIEHLIHDVILGKPRAALFVDDRSMRPDELSSAVTSAGRKGR